MDDSKRMLRAADLAAIDGSYMVDTFSISALHLSIKSPVFL
eukprot:SAG31_NODE_24676_length_476_cov_1.286472_1_plen_40_part_10